MSVNLPNYRGIPQLLLKPRSFYTVTRERLRLADRHVSADVENDGAWHADVKENLSISPSSRSEKPGQAASVGIAAPATANQRLYIVGFLVAHREPVFSGQRRNPGSLAISAAETV